MGAVFKFRMNFPLNYPTEHPTIEFITPVYHPLVNPETGDLDLRGVYNYGERKTVKSIHILKFVKNIFLSNTHMKQEASSNPEAGKLFNLNYEKFCEEARKSSELSRERVYEKTENSTI